MNELAIHNAVCDYLRLKYPEVIFTSESGGLYVPIWLAKQIKKQRSSRGIPDLIILEPKGRFSGLCIEIKRSKEEVYKKNELFRESAHIQEQLTLLKQLHVKGYCTAFGCGLDHCIKLIDDYMSNAPIKPLY